MRPEILVITRPLQRGSFTRCSFHEDALQSAPVITRHPVAITTPSRAPTLADVLAAVNAAGLAERRRQDMASAVRTVARLLDRRLDDIPADPRALALRLKTITPLAGGLSPGRWNNIRSLFRAALELVRPMMKGRSTTPLSPAWQVLADRLPTRADRMALSRLMRWLSGKGIEPDRVMAYKDHLAALGNGSRTILDRLQELGDMARVLAPHMSWDFIKRIASRVRAQHKPVRDKRSASG
jgi:hypothetical protein